MYVSTVLVATFSSYYYYSGYLLAHKENSNKVIELTTNIWEQQS